MTVSLNRLAALLDDQNHVSVDNLILDIVHLENKLAHPEAQSFYFQKGINSVKDRLQGLRHRYAEVMKTINHSSLEELERRAIESKAEWEAIGAHGIHSCLQAMAQGSQEAHTYWLLDMIATKKKYGQLKSLDELSPEDRKRILEHPPYQEGS